MCLLQSQIFGKPIWDMIETPSESPSVSLIPPIPYPTVITPEIFNKGYIMNDGQLFQFSPQNEWLTFYESDYFEGFTVVCKVIYVNQSNTLRFNIRPNSGVQPALPYPVGYAETIYMVNLNVNQWQYYLV